MGRSEVCVRRRWALIAVGAAGCVYYEPPDLPLLDEVPLEPRPIEPCEADREARVACAVDGDTLDLEACGADEGERVRLLGIDAPETEKPGSPAECFADEAAQELARLVVGKDVELSFDAECTGVFDRTLAYVWLVDDDAIDAADSSVTEDLLVDRDGTPSVLVNELLVLTGFADLFDEAWVAPLIYQSELDGARAEASSRGRGLWSACAAEAGDPAALGAGMVGVPDPTRGRDHAVER